MFEDIRHPDYVDTEIAECSSCKDLSVCAGGCPPLKNRYRSFDKALLSEYCNYRVSIRNHLKRFIENRNG
jgi:radical SAM protein with 4Fe4S-binding SPASM domain